jgi:hypothetical protein
MASTSMGWGATMMPLLQQCVCVPLVLCTRILLVGSRESGKAVIMLCPVLLRWSVLSDTI